MMTSEWGRAAVVALAALLVVGIAAGGATAQSATEQRTASLHVIQESHVAGGVTVEDDGDRPVYHAQGPRVYITPQNFPSAEVVDYGIDAEAGRITYDERADLYVLDAQEHDGTFDAFWLVEEERIVGDEDDPENATTETVLVRYTATIQLTNTAIEVNEAGQLAEMEEAADNWNAFADAITSEEVAGEDADVEEEAQAAINYLRLVHNPLDALTGDFANLLVLLFFSLGGLLILSGFGAYHLWATRFEKRYIHRTESLEAEREAIDQRHTELLQKERRQALANMDWADVFESDHVAASFRRAFGETVLDGWLVIQEILLPETLVHDRIEAMGLAGYDVALERDDGDIVDVEFLDPDRPSDADDDIEGEVESIKEMGDEAMNELVLAAEWDDPTIVDFDLRDADFEREELASVLDSPNVDRLIEKVDAQIGPGGDFAHRKEFLRYLIEFVDDVRYHDFTEPDGTVRPLRYLVNTWLKAAHVVSDRYNFPQAEYTAQHLELVLLDQDIGAEVATYVEEVDHGKHS